MIPQSRGDVGRGCPAHSRPAVRRPSEPPVASDLERKEEPPMFRAPRCRRLIRGLPGDSSVVTRPAGHVTERDDGTRLRHGGEDGSMPFDITTFRLDPANLNYGIEREAFVLRDGATERFRPATNAITDDRPSASCWPGCPGRERMASHRPPPRPAAVVARNRSRVNPRERGRINE